jgi:hypothetical protein
MNSVEQAQQTQLNNIMRKTGKNMADLTAIVTKSGLSKHGELRSLVMQKLSLGYGDANAVVHAVLKSDGQRQAENMNQEEILQGIYSGAKADLRAIHEAVMREVQPLGEFEIAPKKGYLSLRRKKQFAMLGPSGSKKVELGLNVKDLPPSARLIEQPKGSMCNYVVRLTDVSQVDAEVVAWIKFAFEYAGEG